MNTLLLAMLALYDITPDDALAVIDQHKAAAERATHLAEFYEVTDPEALISLVDAASLSRDPRSWCPKVEYQRPNRAQRRAHEAYDFGRNLRRERIKEAQHKWSGLAAEAHERRIKRNAERRIKRNAERRNGGAK